MITLVYTVAEQHAGWQPFPPAKRSALLIARTILRAALIGLTVFAAICLETSKILAANPVASPTSSGDIEGPPPLGEPDVVPSAPLPRLQDASKEHPWTNSLGMKFVPVSGTRVLFSIWDTRVQDFSVFVDHTNYNAIGGMYSMCKGTPNGEEDFWGQRGATWKAPGFRQDPTHPVVGVSWYDAKAFCDWLTKSEHSSGRLPKEMTYRLPTDAEWSTAVGLGYEPGNTPYEKNSKIADVYPWGRGWPPPKGAGNYAGEESGRTPLIKGYNDGWPRTSPVGSFHANKFGLYDMGGNVWQWCEDWDDNTHRFPVTRGNSWAGWDPNYLLSSLRAGEDPVKRSDISGFRCVVASDSSR